MRSTQARGRIAAPMSLALTLAAFAMTPQEAAGQQGNDLFTYHVYVDPNFGDNELAFRLNPQRWTGGAPANQQALADYPETPHGKFPNPAIPDEGFLQHAPYSFRTITGPNGAMAYLDAVFPAPPTGNNWTNSVTGKRAEWIVIHCLPGLYGPLTAGDGSGEGEFDSLPNGSAHGSELRFNGEQFPIEMRAQISLQGSSALDTIFDARGHATSIIRAWNTVAGGMQRAFVDGITVRGARSDGGTPFPNNIPNDSGAGISIGWLPQSGSLTVSNCFINDNDVGIAILNHVPYNDEQLHNVVSPVIVNNTIAWNTIGIYSGNPRPLDSNGAYVAQVAIGASQPIILNNIIDPGHPTRGLLTTFRGLHPWDLRQRGNQPFSFNAWPQGEENVVRAGVSNFLAVNSFVRTPLPGSANPYAPTETTPTTWPTPRVDISAYMPGPSKLRGILYVNDAFRAAGDPGRSPHDFRLAPNVASSADAEAIGPNGLVALNPMVNMGLALETDAAIATGRTSITFANHSRYIDFLQGTPAVGGLGNPLQFRRLDHPPGYEIPSATTEEPDRFHAWDWDAEGFGNPRVRCRRGFTSWSPGSQTLFDNIDLGADEMGELIIAGYIDGTRMFARWQIFDVGAEQTDLYFFDLRSSAPYARPSYNLLLGDNLTSDNPPPIQPVTGFNWWDHSCFPATPATNLDSVSITQNGWGTGSVINSNFTDAADPRQPAGTSPFRFFYSFASNATRLTPPDSSTPDANPVFMRNLPCDFSPTLLGDPHPYWGDTYFPTADDGIPSVGTLGDFYASNPWFGDTNPAPPNVEPLSSIHLRADSSIIAIANWTLYRNPDHPSAAHRGGVVDGTLNPPGTAMLGDALNPVTVPECSGLHPSVGFLRPPLVGTLGPFGCTPTGSYDIGFWGFGDSNCVGEKLPLLFDWVGVRYNCQNLDEDEGSNLQTFLTVIGDASGSDSQEAAQRASAIPGFLPSTGSSLRYDGPRGVTRSLSASLRAILENPALAPEFPNGSR